jgi:AraC-like DNA-binding protein
MSMTDSSAGLGKRRLRAGCTMGSVMPSTRQARERTRRARDTEGLELGRNPKPNRSRPVESVGPLNDTSLAAPGALALRRLAAQLARYAPHDDVFPLRLPGTYAVRRSRLTTEPTYSTTSPALCVVAQGAKVVMLGRDVLEYDPTHVLVFAVDLPVASQVTRASLRDPYLGFVLSLDPTRVAELAVRVYPRGVPKVYDNRGLYVGRATDGMVEAVTRLLDLMTQAEDANLLGPLVVDEILIRLLRTSIGPRVAQIGQPKSGVHRVAEAVSWIRAHFAQPVTVDEMAASVHMSTSSFHQRFKAVTSMSPLQYQKVLRLHEARRLMLFQKVEASDACYRVGYLSPSQFSREYARFFGSAPTKDIARLRDRGETKDRDQYSAARPSRPDSTTRAR